MTDREFITRTQSPVEEAAVLGMAEPSPYLFQSNEVAWSRPRSTGREDTNVLDDVKTANDHSKDSFTKELTAAKAELRLKRLDVSDVLFPLGGEEFVGHVGMKRFFRWCGGIRLPTMFTEDNVNVSGGIQLDAVASLECVNAVVMCHKAIILGRDWVAWVIEAVNDLGGHLG